MAKINLQKTATGSFGIPPIGCAGLGINTDEELVVIHENGDEEVVDGLTQTILNGRKVWVNQEYEASVPARRVFVTKAEADAWLAELTGGDAPDEDNHWAIEFGDGYIDEDCIAYPYVDIILTPGTQLKSLTALTEHIGYNVGDSRVFGGMVEMLYVAEDTIVALESCIIKEIQPVVDDGDGYVHMEDCWVFGGDFSNTQQPLLAWNNVRLFATIGDISGLGNIMLVNGMVATSGVFSIIDLPKTMIHGYISADSLVLEGNSCELYSTIVNGVISLESSSTLKIYYGTHLSDPPVKLDPSATITDYRFVIPQYADNSAAVAGGLVVGSMYWNTTSTSIVIVTA